MPVLIKSETKNPSAWRERLIVCGMFLIFSLLLFYTARDLEQEYRLYRHGIFTEGTALKSVSVRGGYDVAYKFNYNGITWQATSDAKEGWLYPVKFPAKIRVNFLADDPNISRLPDVRKPSLFWFNIFFFCFFCLAVFVSGLNILGEGYEILRLRKAKHKGTQPWHLPAYSRAWH
jgi:hypothetical protein